MSFLNTEHDEGESGAGKFVLGALALLIVLGGAGYWFLGRSPSKAAEPPPETSSPAVETKAPPPAPKKTVAKKNVSTTGTLVVRANVDGASVYVDDKKVGAAPFTDKAIHIGHYRVRVTKDGYGDYVENVRVRPGRKAELRAELDLLPPSLRVDSDVKGATVFLDRAYKGTTPVEIKNVAPGNHQLTVSAEGYEMHADTISITTGHRDITINFQEAVREFQESISVVHKHSFGKCQGNLIADANGIRYDTAHKHAFAIPYSKLERFEIDYIKKNLNLKVRKGKNYNFTEQSGDADALFVFHKNVKAYMDKL